MFTAPVVGVDQQAIEAPGWKLPDIENA